MLINVMQPEECRIAILEDGQLEELYVERTNQEGYVGNIYKGRIVNIEPGIQAAFVDFGVERNGFLHVSDVDPTYFKKNGPLKPGAERRSVRGKPPIQEVFRRGQEVLVQVIKEGMGTKGPTLSTYVSLPGRYLVLMPGMSRVGVSRKIDDESQRKRLKEILSELKPPKDLGFIVRTAGMEQSKRALSRDLAYLMRLWKAIVGRIKSQKAPAEIYQESDMVIRTIRDILTSDIESVVIDEEAALDRARDFLRIAMPRQTNILRRHEGKEPLFQAAGVEDEIAKIQQRRVPITGGGSIVIDQTEALVAIDVNSGSFRVSNDAEETALQMNLLASKEIARQLRLRDIGGVVVIDFIDLREEKKRRLVERAMRDAMKRDRARARLSRMSNFGLMEMTRQRIRGSLKSSVYEDCTHCGGTGQLKTAESMGLEAFRLLMMAVQKKGIRRVEVKANPAVADYLSNMKRDELARLESESEVKILVRTQPLVGVEQLDIDGFDAENNPLSVATAPAPEKAPAAKRSGRRRGGRKNR